MSVAVADILAVDDVRFSRAAPEPPEIVVCDELAFLIEAARAAARMSHCNHVGLRYAERRDALARLRGALIAYDRERGAV